METLVIVFIAVVVVYSGRSFWRPRALHQKRRKRYAPKTRKEPAHYSPRRSFDAESARPVQIREQLVGHARIVDGDTLVICRVQIRLFGVDAPELNHPYGKKAKWALVSLCKGSQVRAEILEEDHFGRTVARCYLPDGRDLSAEMVKLGMAIDWPKFSGGVYQELEPADARRKLWLADARQKGRMHVWEAFEARQAQRRASED